MKKKILAGLIGIFLISIPLAGAAPLPDWAIPLKTTVVKSRHNLSVTNAYTGTTEAESANKTIDADQKTAEVCVFCHTPHGANLEAVGAPIWNKKVGPEGSYQMYSSPTIDTNIHKRPTGVSLACLSCHDGTMAMDTMINAPGSGGYVKEGKSQGYSWSWRAGYTDNGGKMPTESVANLGQDLRNDHPISMPYAGAIEGARDAIDPKFNPAVEVRQGKIAVVKRSLLNSTQTGVTDGNLRLFRSGDPEEQQNGSDTDYLVQCASCHNPHGTDSGGTEVDSATGNEAYPTFLQRPNTASELCVTCHIK